MKKAINITMLVLICAGAIFGTWSDHLYLQYIDKGITPPESTFCLHDRIENIWGGIVGIWAGINLVFKPASFIKLFGKTDCPSQIFFTMCFGVMCLLIGILSLGNVITSNLVHCG